MSDYVRHPGAQAGCKICLGKGLRIVADGAVARAIPCTCVGPCPVCRGAGFVATGTTFRAPKRRCDCTRAEVRGRLFDEARIPGRYAHATLTDLRKDGRSLAAGIAAAYIGGWRRGEPHRGLVFYGDVGRGKTHLMIAVLRELVLRHGASVRFVEFSHLLADLKLSFERGGTADLVEPLTRVDVLAIDELGKGRNTEFEGTVLDELISRRYNAGTTILGTTNFRPGAATGHSVPNHAQPRDTLPTLADRVSDRVYSRLRETCDFHEVGGDDLREVLSSESRLAARRAR